MEKNGRFADAPANLYYWERCKYSQAEVKQALRGQLKGYAQDPHTREFRKGGPARTPT